MLHGVDDKRAVVRDWLTRPASLPTVPPIWATTSTILVRWAWSVGRWRLPMPIRRFDRQHDSYWPGQAVMERSGSSATWLSSTANKPCVSISLMQARVARGCSNHHDPLQTAFSAHVANEAGFSLNRLRSWPSAEKRVKNERPVSAASG